jgi:hypothetical protein
MKSVNAGILLCLLIIATASMANANLIMDGDFEGSVGITGQTGWTNLQSLTGWASYEGDKTFEIQKGLYGSNKSQYLELAPNRPQGIEQSIATVAGRTYSISFDYSARPDAPTGNNGLFVGAGSLNQYLTRGNSADWGHYIYTFTATSSSTNIRFAASNQSPTSNSSYGPLIDNITVDAYATPEPTTMLLMGLGLVGGVVMRKRLKRAGV